MAMQTSTAVPPERRRWVPAHLRWPVGYAIAAAGIFLIFYYRNLLDPGFMGFMDRWLPLSTINAMVLWVVFALGLNIVVGYAGLLDLGYVAFWAIGGYTAGWLMSTFFDQWHVFVLGSERPELHGIHVSFWFVMIAAAAVCALCGVIIGAPTLRLRSDYLALVTLGFGEIIPQFIRNGDRVGTLNFTNGARGISPVDRIQAGTLRLGPFDLAYKYVIFVVLAALMMFISLRLRHGKIGRAWLAIREDEVAASAMGVPLMRTKLLAYGIGAMAGGIGGVAFATHVNAVFPDRFDFSISITLLAMVVLGGMGNVWGVTLGALIVAWVNAIGLDQGGQAFNSVFGTNINFPSWNYLFFGGALVLMMLFRREGFIPEARTRLVLREAERTTVSGIGDIEVTELEEQAAATRIDSVGERL
ncbi:MAG TPA: branched-chain amino acid ABC transporter permease [Micromonosporaceae bacterium]|jgi:branched-chain amino acid transport system permease protein|nr:branched-chain amino acid ABC transporter permease [Micromonosporaceae bacterium]